MSYLLSNLFQTMDLKFLPHQKYDLFYILHQQRPGEFFHWLLFSQLHGMILVTKLICYVMGLIICSNYLFIRKMLSKIFLTQVSDFISFSKMWWSGPKLTILQWNFKLDFIYVQMSLVWLGTFIGGPSLMLNPLDRFIIQVRFDIFLSWNPPIIYIDFSLK